MKLVLFGGVQGVGKTTLLSWCENQFKSRITLLNPGELFRWYFYDEKIKTTEEIEELVVSELEKMPDNATAVLHWHYAVSRPSGFIPQISFSRLKRIAESGRIEQVVLLVLEASPDSIYERRLKDYQGKKRELSISVICEELRADEEFFTKEQALFTQALGGKSVSTVRLANADVDAAKAALCEFFKALLR